MSRGGRHDPPDGVFDDIPVATLAHAFLVVGDPKVVELPVRRGVPEGLEGHHIAHGTDDLDDPSPVGLKGLVVGGRVDVQFKGSRVIAKGLGAKVGDGLAGLGVGDDDWDNSDVVGHALVHGDAWEPRREVSSHLVLKDGAETEEGRGGH